MDKRSRKEVARREAERREGLLGVLLAKQVHLLKQHHSDEPGGPRGLWFTGLVTREEFHREEFQKLRQSVAVYPRDGWGGYEVEADDEPVGQPVTDFVNGLGFYLFSGRAVRVLRDLLEPCGVLLPLAFRDGEFWLFRLDAVVDALDASRTSASWMHAPGVQGIASAIYSWAFVTDRLNDKQIFRVPQHYSLLVLNEFAERVRAAGLHGFKLEKIWPNARMAAQIR